MQVNGNIVTSFVELEAAVDGAITFDDATGAAGPGTVTMVVERGGERLTVVPKVRRFLTLDPSAMGTANCDVPGCCCAGEAGC